MTQPTSSPQANIPSLDLLLRHPAAGALMAQHGRTAVTRGLRLELETLRAALANEVNLPEPREILSSVANRLEAQAQPGLKPVFNLTGTVLHTNLGRAPLPEEAIAAMVEVAGKPANLEFDLETGKRGDRDTHIEALICDLTGAEAATVVNNNAAAVLLALNSLANRREVPVSRGELVEIGGSFRIPDIMKRSGAKLVEVGTTNRTHLKDFEEAISPQTGLLMKVHTSNYSVEGFTAEVGEEAVADLAHANGLALMVDLGSGTLADFSALGLPPEPTPAKSFADGVDLVTFSGDKLLGGPQAGIIAGRADLIAKIKRNPMKRALRIDKVTIAALGAVLRLYRDPDSLARRLPALRLLVRSVEEIGAVAARIAPVVTARLGDSLSVEIVDCASQIGSGALPKESLVSKALRLTPPGSKRKRGKALDELAANLRRLPVPVVGRIHDGALHLDLRCLEDEAGFCEQLVKFDFGAGQ